MDLLKPRADGLKQAFARLGRRHTARGAGQEPQTEPFFEAANRVAKRRLRNAQLRRGFCGAALLPYSQEGPQVIQIAAVL